MEGLTAENITLPKNTKENRYYYRHRDEVLARKKEQRMSDPEYRARQEEREKNRLEREAEKERKRLEREAMREKKRLEQEANNKMKLEIRRAIKANALLGKSPGV